MSRTYVVHRPWSIEDQRVYLRRAFEEYRVANPTYGCKVEDGQFVRYLSDAVAFNHPHLSALYRIGLEGGYIRMDFQEFQRWMLDWNRYLALPGQAWPHPTSPYRAYPSLAQEEVYHRFYPRQGAHYRCRVPLNITEPKVVDEAEQSRRDWRDRKGFNHRRGRHWWSGGRRRGYERSLGHRENRRWEKRAIRNGDFEALADQNATLKKVYLDPWRWD